MRIAVNITHPAHFHFFRNAIREWIRQGDEVLILSREKDVTLPLLAEAGYPNDCLSRSHRGLAGLAIELIQHGYRARKAMSKHRSQVAVAIGGTFMVHAALLTRTPALVFYDTENAKLSNTITYPFATRIYTPRSYRNDLGTKHVRYNGFQELAYLHPARFRPDPQKLTQLGLKEGDPFIFVRLVAWESHHDIGDYGVSDLKELVARLQRYGRVVISSESPLPGEFQKLAYTGKIGDVHHILAFARLVFGESATMVTEGAQLGVPGVFLSSSGRGYTDELETRYKMVSNFNGAKAVQSLALDRADEILNSQPSIYRQRHRMMMAEQIDVTSLILDEVRTLAREN